MAINLVSLITQFLTPDMIARIASVSFFRTVKIQSDQSFPTSHFIALFIVA